MPSLDTLLKQFGDTRNRAILPNPSVPPYPDPIHPPEGQSIRGEYAAPKVPAYRPPTESTLILPDVDPNEPAAWEPETDVPTLLRLILDELRTIKPGGASNVYYEKMFSLPTTEVELSFTTPLPWRCIYIPFLTRASGTVTLYAGHGREIYIGQVSNNERLRAEMPVETQTVTVVSSAGDAANVAVYLSANPFSVFIEGV